MTTINLSAVSDFKVLVVGDAIMDEYCYVRIVGKAVKEPALSAVTGRATERFRGGVWAAAAHLNDLCAKVDTMHDENCMFNTRFVEETYNRKLFVLHELKLGDRLPKGYDIKSYDLVIVTDFGHGTMTPERIKVVSDDARYLAVNAQTNSTNYGFNLITKYPRADFVVLDELEARLAAHERDAPMEDVILKLGYKKIIVTMGANGAIGFDGAFERAPSVAHKVADTMGAGDAFLAVTAPFAAAGFSMKQLLRIGNAAGAAKVGIVGHRSSVTKEALEKHLG